MKREYLHEVLSGKSRGISAMVARAGLRCLEPAYRAAVRYRNFRFDRSHGTTKVSVPVLSIGNITTGGTGKTPMVRWMIERLTNVTERPAIVSRGYGSESGQPNDEFLELQEYLPDTPHIQDPDRIAAANEAINKHSATAIVLDDGFQHRRLTRDLDIVLIDLTCPFGFEHLLPRGLLREPIDSLARADAFVLTRCSQVSKQQVIDVRSRLAAFCESNNGSPPKLIAEVSFRADEWVAAENKLRNYPFDIHQPVFPFCGIGNPQNFEESMRSQLNDVRGFRAFPDHYSFAQSDIDEIQAEAKTVGAKALVCTMKDLVKLRSLSLPDLPLFAASIRVNFESGEELLVEKIRGVVSSRLKRRIH